MADEACELLYAFSALHSDASVYGGGGVGTFGLADAVPIACHGQPFSLSLTLPPLSAIFLERSRGVTAAPGAAQGDGVG